MPRVQTPQPLVYPACSKCDTPFVLRRAFTFAVKGGCPRGSEWVYQRDCRHSAAPITMVDNRKKSKR